MTATALRGPAAWLPAGIYLAPVLDEDLTPYWAEVTADGTDAVVLLHTAGLGPRTPDSVACAAAFRRIAAAPGFAQGMWGRLTGRCAICHSAIDSDDDQLLGAHRGCTGGWDALGKATAGMKAEIRKPVLETLVLEWRTADIARRARVLRNIGPVTMLKLDNTARRIEGGLPAAGGPAPECVIKDREDPRVPGWAAELADRMSALDDAGLAAVWQWVDVDSMRHMAADLATDGPTVMQGASCKRLSEVATAIGEARRTGRLLSVSLQPRLTLRALVEV